MSEPCLFGMEWECALGQADLRAPPVNPEFAYRTLRDELRVLQPWLPDVESTCGIFVPGFRFYLDVGGHPEVAGVEVTSPDEFVALKQANFALLAQALHQARRTIPGLVMLANNHDYLSGAENGDGTFWGCHESYATRVPPGMLAEGMLPFLASRPLIAGSGRIDPHGRVLLSPRAQAMELPVGGSTTSDRALYSTSRNEPLMSRGPFRYRTHVICGDAVVSPFTEFLKVGTTALVFLWLQEDPKTDSVPRLGMPLSVLQKANVLWEPDGQLHIDKTALTLQRSYCTAVAQFVDRHPHLPPWCAKTVQLWDETLRLLASDPLELSDRHDPFIKLAMFDAALAHLGRSWTDVARDGDLYKQLALMDLAYHQVDEDGPLMGLADLVRRVRRSPPGLDNPPTPQEVVSRLITRAAPRAQLIAQHSGLKDVRCGWNKLWRTTGQWVDLDDPTSIIVPDWHQPTVRRSERESAVQTWVHEVPRLHDRGAYQQAAALLADMAREPETLSPAQRIHFLRQRALVQSRLGEPDCIHTLNELSQIHEPDLMLINDYVCAYRYLGLAPPQQIKSWIRRGWKLRSEDRGSHRSTEAAFLGHVGYLMLRSAQPQRAHSVLSEAEGMRAHAHPHVFARVLADLADAQRMLGQPAEAQRLLQEAEVIQTDYSFEGDRADFTWTCRARLETDRGRALDWLARAKEVQTRLHNGMGEARSLVLEGRIAADRATATPLCARLCEFQTQHPALAACSLLTQILNHWDDWIMGRPRPRRRRNADAFWNV